MRDAIIVSVAQSGGARSRAAKGFVASNQAEYRNLIAGTRTLLWVYLDQAVQKLLRASVYGVIRG